MIFQLKTDCVFLTANQLSFIILSWCYSQNDWFEKESFPRVALLLLDPASVQCTKYHGKAQTVSIGLPKYIFFKRPVYIGSTSDSGSDSTKFFWALSGTQNRFLS